MNKKEIVGVFLGSVLQQDAEKMRALANVDYVQHSPFIPTGLEPFIQLLPVFKESGTTANNIRMFQDGNYVFMHNTWQNAEPLGANEMVSFDVIRLDNNGKIAEHWDALMPNTPPNPSGRTLTEGPTEVKDLNKTEENKKLIVDLFETMINGTPEEGGAAFQKAFAMDYKQYNPNAGDGWEGFMSTQMATGTPRWVFTKQHMVLGEGNYVLSIAEGTENGIPSAFYDLVRIEEGKIVDHWDVVQKIPTEGLANKNGMFNF